MKKNTVPVASLPGAPRLKADDDREFKRRWFRFGMALKAKADGYDLDWRKMSMEAWFKAITGAEKWHQSEEECERQ